jgi:hypothetical protein
LRIEDIYTSFKGGNGHEKIVFISFILFALLPPLTASVAQPTECLYWADSATNKIGRFTLDGSQAETILQERSADPYQIALDLGAGHLYWTDLTFGSIQRSDLDGSGVEEIVASGLLGPQRLALTVSDPTPIIIDPALAVTLHQNFPNPFNPSTLIPFTLPAPDAVTLAVYGVDGRRINTLINEMAVEGYNGIEWNGTDQFGNRVASGIYFYRLTAGNQTITKKMTLLK